MPDHPAGIPALRVRDLASYIERLEAIRRDAEADGLGTLAYLIACAEHEARGLIEQGERERQAREADPGELWQPATGGDSAP